MPARAQRQYQPSRPTAHKPSAPKRSTLIPHSPTPLRSSSSFHLRSTLLFFLYSQHLHNIIFYLLWFAFCANIVNSNWILTLVGMHPPRFSPTSFFVLGSLAICHAGNEESWQIAEICLRVKPGDVRLVRRVHPVCSGFMVYLVSEPCALRIMAKCV